MKIHVRTWRAIQTTSSTIAVASRIPTTRNTVRGRKSTTRTGPSGTTAASRPGRTVDCGRDAGDHPDQPRPDPPGALSGRRAEDRRQLREARERRLLRPRHLSPGHPGLHDPGRRSHRHRLGRPGLHVRGRVQRPQGRARCAGHGKRRPEHERQPVLHRHHRGGTVARRASTRSSGA